MADAHNAGKLEIFDASDYRVGIVVGLFNSHITGPMKEVAMKELTEEYRVPTTQVVIAEVAGAADMPAVLEAMARKDDIDCVVALGAIIRGATAHFDYVAKAVTEGVVQTQCKHAKPVAFGVLTTDTEEQATVRIEHAAGYAAAALHAARAIRALQ